MVSVHVQAHSPPGKVILFHTTRSDRSRVNAYTLPEDFVSWMLKVFVFLSENVSWIVSQHV